MVVLDTDHLSLLEHGTSVESMRLRAKLAALPKSEVQTTIVNYEEQMRGWLAFMAQCRAPARQIVGYGKLKRHLTNFCRLHVLDFNGAAAEEYQRLQEMRLRVATMDLRIASIVLVNDALLLSRNPGDFRKIPGLDAEDWTT